MVDAVMKVLTFFVVLILILLILNLAGDYIAAQIPQAAEVTRRIVQALWNGLQRAAQPAGYQH
ncbi:MAG TPA: hypothetical protein VFW64_14545 [Pseudonocardiaceae bacterium]|nr:hypothetical protein [Pseudonocardiaceae bacterium]